MKGVLARVAALVVAVGLIVGAVMVRTDREGPSGDAGTAPDVAGDGTEVLCASEYEAVCRAALPDDPLRARPIEGFDDVLEAGEVAAALVPAAWADLVDDERARSGLPALARSEVVASTPLLLVAFEDRAQVLAAACATAVEALTWDCVGTQAGRRWDELGGDVRWGSVTLGHLAPDTATGLQATTAVIAARTGLPFSLADLRDPGFATWFRQLERAVGNHRPAGGSHLTGMLTRGPSVANVAVATEAETTQRSLDTAFGPIVVVAAEPVLAVELVVVGLADRAVRDAYDALRGAAARSAFTEAGWRTSEAAPAGSPVAELPPVSETPSGGVLTAVRSAWGEAAG